MSQLVQITTDTDTTTLEVVAAPEQAHMDQVSRYLAGVSDDAGAGAQHDPRWLRVLQDGLGHQPMMILARTNHGDLCGYLPLARVTSRLFGRFLVSLPYLNQAGPVSDAPHIRSLLVDRAIELAQQNNVQYLELRQHQPIANHPGLSVARDGKAAMVLSLPEDNQALWSQISSKVRNQIRKADKNNLSIRWGSVQIIDDFYEVFSVNMRDLGTPVYPKKLFACILDNLPDQAELAVVYHQNLPIAAALLVHAQASTLVPSASSLRRFNHTNANMWMYHQLLQRAIDKGNPVFDFGRSTVNSGTYRFKKQWGAKPHPTVWQYHVRHGDINKMRPDHPRYRRRVAAWQKLPVWVTRLVGPTIVRGIP